LEWNERHRPRTLADVAGNSKAIQALEAWARSWDRGPPKRRAVILVGPPGCGKTVAAHALGADMGWEVIELNASDNRDAASITRVATAGALNQTFMAGGEFTRSAEGGRKLIILDEADNIHGREDKGGIRAIVDTIRRTQQPVVLIANDLYELTRLASALKTLCEVIKFQSIQSRTVRSVLQRISAAERLEVEEDALTQIAERASGDLRSAVNDLQAVALGRTFVGVKDVGAVGKRDVRTTMFEAVRTILKTDNCLAARRVTTELDEEPEFLLLWLSENVPEEYRGLVDLARAMECLARADLFLARARRTKNYRLWAYASDLMTAGVATAKDREYRLAPRYRFPLWLATMGRTRALRATMSSLSSKIALECHTSTGIAREELVPMYQHLFSLDGAFAVHQAAVLELDEQEAAMLLEDRAESTRVQQLLEAAASRETGRTQVETYGLGSTSTFGRAGPAKPPVKGKGKDKDKDKEKTGAEEAPPAPAEAAGRPASEGADKDTVDDGAEGGDKEDGAKEDADEGAEHQRSLLDFGH